MSGKTLTHSDLDAFVGKHVEVTVVEDEALDIESTNVEAANAVRIHPVMRRFGTMAGRFSLSEDFDQPLPPDIQCYFDGKVD